MYAVTIQKEQFTVKQEGENFLVDGQPIIWDLKPIGERTFHLIQNGKSYTIEVVSINKKEKTLVLHLNNKPVSLQLEDKFDLLLKKLGMNMAASHSIKQITSPMPGLIHDIKVNLGDQVKKGDPVLVLEAMKMENIIKSPGDGEVKKITVQIGDSVEKNEVLIQF